MAVRKESALEGRHLQPRQTTLARRQANFIIVPDRADVKIIGQILYQAKIRSSQSVFTIQLMTA